MVESTSIGMEILIPHRHIQSPLILIYGSLPGNIHLVILPQKKNRVLSIMLVNLPPVEEKEIIRTQHLKIVCIRIDIPHVFGRYPIQMNTSK